MDDQALQELLAETTSTLGAAGAQLAVFHDGKVREFAAGSRDVELGLPVTTSTLFQIGSTTKVFNACVILSLVECGLLDLDSPVREFIPDFHLASLGAEQEITLGHLLSMSSGLDNGTYHEYGRGDDALGRYVETQAGIPQIFAPGAAYGYSNAGTCVAGYAATVVTNRPWESLLSDRVLSPLGLRHTCAHTEDLLLRPLALGYGRKSKDEPLLRVDRWGLYRSMAPAGGTLCASAGDLVRFARMFLDKGKSEQGSQVISEISVERMHTPVADMATKLMAEKWCLGPYWKRWGGFELYGHGGTTMNGSSMLLWCPEKNIAAATTVNVPDQGYPLADRIFDVVFPQLFGIDKPATPKSDDFTPYPTDFRRFVGRYESFGFKVDIEIADRTLVATANTRTMGDVTFGQRSELIPIDAWRFIPRDPAMSGNRAWDVAFWADDNGERPTHYLHGTFALRRTQ